MKKPNITHCPCCGNCIIAVDAPLRANVRAKCEDQIEDGDGAMRFFRMYWQCEICGCTWLHGQFDEANKKTP